MVIEKWTYEVSQIRRADYQEQQASGMNKMGKPVFVATLKRLSRWSPKHAPSPLEPLPPLFEYQVIDQPRIGDRFEFTFSSVEDVGAAT